MKEIELTVSFGFLGQGIIPIHGTAMLKRYNDCCIGYYIKDYEGNYHLVDWFNEGSELGKDIASAYKIDYSEL